MSVVHYQIWKSPQGDYGMTYPEHSRKLIASGALTIAETISSAVRIPKMPAGEAVVPVVQLRVAGTDRAYVILADRDAAPSGTGTHAYADELPRIMLEASDGYRSVPMAQEGAFAVVRAAAVA